MTAPRRRFQPPSTFDGFTLVAVDVDGNYDDAANWRSSALQSGSPGQPDPTPIPGDFNGDGVVDRRDVVRLASHYGRASGAYRSTGDVNFDGAAGLIDAALLQLNFGRTIGASPSAPAAAAPPLAPATADAIAGRVVAMPSDKQRPLAATRRFVRPRGSDGDIDIEVNQAGKSDVDSLAGEFPLSASRVRGRSLVKR